MEKKNLLQKFNKKYAFTLAEVLITMTLIGAIAAMTLPNLNNSFKRREYSTRLKNFVSRMESAVQQMETEKGSFRNMTKPANSVECFNWYMENIDPYMGHQFVDKTNRWLYFKDGSRLQIVGPGTCLDVVYDTNGKKNPNTYGTDYFRFLFCFTDESRASWFGSKDIFFGTYVDTKMSN